MMKKVLFILLMISFSFWGMGQNLVLNGDFENWTGINPDNWTASGDGISISGDPYAQSGQNSCEVFWDSQSNQYLTSDAFNVTEGEEINASFWVADNDPAGRARLCIIYEGASNYYGTYSEDMAGWQQLTYTNLVPAGATSAEFQIRFYDVSSNWDGDATVFVDNVVYEYNTTVYPEPTNYPSDFNATVDVTDIDLGWLDDTEGDQLPQAYLVLGKMIYQSEFVVPVDGTPVENDNDWSDGYAAINIPYGDEEAVFQFLQANLQYDFAIFPYTNTGDDIDYKTDGTYPVAGGATDNVVYSIYETFDPEASRDMMAYNVTGEQVWEWANFGNPPGCQKMSGYAGGANENEDWLITSSIDMTAYSNMLLRFDHARNYASNSGLFVMVSTDYDGTSDPSTNGTWTDITSLFTFPSGGWNFIDAGIGDVSAYISPTTYFAFKYTSTNAAAATWEVDNVRVYTYVPVITVIDPNGGEILEQGSQYEIIWDHDYWVEENVAIYLAQGAGKDLTLITESTPVADGSYTWTVWSSIEPGDDFMIYLESPEGTNDYSDDFFSIVAAGELIADFEADTTMIYVGDSVLFTDLTIGAATSWLWTFEGGTPATFDGQEPPYIHYAEAGSWDVTLEVSDDVRTTDVMTKTDYIVVSEMPVLPPPEDLEGTVDVLDVLLSWTAPGGGGPTGFEDDFESYDDFVLEFAPWTNVDVDGSDTYGMTGVDWPNAGAPQAYIIFNPTTTTPPVDDMTAHSGNKLAACLAAIPSPTNDDWMITPLVDLADNSHLSFWAKSYTDDYGLERFRVGVSTTGMDPADFTIISEGDYVEAPVEDWTEFTYDLSAYNGQQIYVGIQCVSNDAFILMIDDVYIGADKSAIVYNPAQPVIGKATKQMNYFAQATPQPAVAPVSSGLRDDPVLQGYNVYRDDDQINAELVELTTYTDIEPSIGTHNYYVTAVYDMGESVHSDTVTIVVTGVDELSLESVSVYPNPSNGKFTVGLPAGADVELNVMDLTGKSVYRSAASETVTIDLSKLYKGMYLLHIYDRNNDTSVVKKLVIK
ncbi:MAG: hypothetical protein DRJ02_01150 [Bacteroidetes bacterium]|nr:MAG: hypothetical protein DRI87_02205 [Bacteroidota bacterium]RLD89556.1 MAG: hypothetical protein DRJ02_01150 [Bacteroidota bacterium]